MGGGCNEEKDFWAGAAFILFFGCGLTMLFTSGAAMFAAAGATCVGILALVVWQGKT